MGVTAKDIEKLTGPQKVAIVLLSLSDENATRIFSLMSLLPGLIESIPIYSKFANEFGVVILNGEFAQVDKKASLTSLGDINFCVLS